MHVQAIKSRDRASMTAKHLSSGRLSLIKKLRFPGRDALKFTSINRQNERILSPRAQLPRVYSVVKPTIPIMLPALAWLSFASSAGQLGHWAKSPAVDFIIRAFISNSV
jgi:hypothetical protein